ncbi:transposase [Microbulbifer sp. 2205BS26-8]
MEAVTEWQNRPLDRVYPIVYLDCIVLKSGCTGGARPFRG